MIPAFIISRNSPSVNNVIGIVSRTSTGLTRVLNKDSTAATKIPVKPESITTPGKINEVMITAKVLMISWTRRFIVQIFRQGI